jgi:hypothetical protein
VREVSSPPWDSIAGIAGRDKVPRTPRERKKSARVVGIWLEVVYDLYFYTLAHAAANIEKDVPQKGLY